MTPVELLAVLWVLLILAVVLVMWLAAEHMRSAEAVTPSVCRPRRTPEPCRLQLILGGAGDGHATVFDFDAAEPEPAA